MLVIDVGNTTTHFGVFEKGRLRVQFSLATQPPRETRRLAEEVGRLARARRIRLDQTHQALICSVVPRMTPAVVRVLRALRVERVRLVGRDVRVPLKNRYRYPGQVGQDRLVGAYAAWAQFGRRRGKDCIVCDFGTAITIDVVTKDGSYLGGIIALLAHETGDQARRDPSAARTGFEQSGTAPR